jgi:hypothetical protein
MNQLQRLGFGLAASPLLFGGCTSGEVPSPTSEATIAAPSPQPGSQVEVIKAYHLPPKVCEQLGQLSITMGPKKATLLHIFGEVIDGKTHTYGEIVTGDVLGYVRKIVRMINQPGVIDQTEDTVLARTSEAIDAAKTYANQSHQLLAIGNDEALDGPHMQAVGIEAKHAVAETILSDCPTYDKSQMFNVHK